LTTLSESTGATLIFTSGRRDLAARDRGDPALVGHSWDGANHGCRLASFPPQVSGLSNGDRERSANRRPREGGIKATAQVKSLPEDDRNERKRSVKPSAQPTLVRTQHLPHLSKQPLNCVYAVGGCRRLRAGVGRYMPLEAGAGRWSRDICGTDAGRNRLRSRRSRVTARPPYLHRQRQAKGLVAAASTDVWHRRGTRCAALSDQETQRTEGSGRQPIAYNATRV
jgi:hypothetical protein